MSPRNGVVLGTTTIVDNGPSSGRWDLVIMGDGFTAAEIPQFSAEVSRVTSVILSTPPFDELRPAINVHRIDVASTESGVGDLCSGVRRATYFDANFCIDGIQRLLISDIATVLDTAITAVPQMNAPLVIANSPIYGGGASGGVPTFSMASTAVEIALHEMGHAHFGLADEYPLLNDCREADHGQYNGQEPAEPNVTSRLTSLKWSAVATTTAIPTTKNADCNDCDQQSNPLSPQTVGAYEGARYYRCGMFRPQFDCRMRNLGVPYCAVCSATIKRVLWPFVPRKRAAKK